MSRILKQFDIFGPSPTFFFTDGASIWVEQGSRIVRDPEAVVVIAMKFFREEDVRLVRAIVSGVLPFDRLSELQLTGQVESPVSPKQIGTEIGFKPAHH